MIGAILGDIVGSPYEFDQSCSGQWYLDGTHMFYLHTLYPDAVYMMVHVPQ